MSILRDITDEMRNVLKWTSNASDKLDKASRKSFARSANEQTFQFPCMVTDSIPVGMASTITRNLDMVYASFVQICLSAQGIIDLNYVKNPKQFIAQYQSQFKLESVEEEDTVLKEFEEEYADFTEAGGSLFIDNDNKIYMAFTEGAFTPTMRKELKEGMTEFKSLYSGGPVTIYEKNEDLKKDMVDAYLNGKSNKETLDATSKSQGPKMSDRDVKKLNDMKPYVMELKLLVTKGDSSLAQYVTYDVGVKTTLHLGKADKLVQNLVYVLKNKNATFNFIRWTTGELSLMKDIILNLNDINFNIANKSDSTGKFISLLKRMKKKPVKISSSGLSKTTPFATIVISSYEYNTILNDYGFDLKNIMFARKIMEELYLMCFVIVDEGTQTIDMLIDGSTSGFQTYSLDILERETTNNSSKLSKELTRMLGGN